MNNEVLERLKEEYGDCLLYTSVIKGRVLDENREPMIGVLVLIKGTTHGVTTGVDGDYLLEFTEKEPTLEFSFLGYEPRDFKLTPDQKVLNVNMKPSRIRVKDCLLYTSIYSFEEE